MSASFTPMFETSRLNSMRSAIRTAIKRPSAEDAAGGNRVLVVDDDPQVLSLLDKVVRRMGFEARTISSLDAVDKTATAGAALLLLDLHVGGDHALSLIQQLSLAGITIPVVLMSGYFHADSDIADVVVRKPLSARDLATSMARVLRPEPESAVAAPPSASRA